MSINNEILKKYNPPSIEEFEGREGIWAVMLLEVTDHIPLKIFESFIETMTDNVNIGNMIKFFKEVKTEYAEVLAARKFAREEINRLEADKGE